jgi:hypothetical protein
MDNEKILAQHKLGIGGLWSLYPRDLLWKAIKWPLVISSILLVGFVATQVNSQKLVTAIVDAVISVMPSLLGFLLGGYTILISFVNNDLARTLTKNTNKRNVSVFQLVSFIFALTILLQSITLALALIGRFSMLNTIALSIESKFAYVITAVNYAFAYVLLILLLYTIFAFKDIIANIFNLTQLFHHSLLKQRLAKEAENKRDE